MMELPAAPVIFLSLFIVGSLSLFLVYKFGMKKKSYEEVLAEQRKQTSAILGTKPKPKEKKNKKAAKKIKEKSTTYPEPENTDETESVDSKEAPEIVNPPSQQGKASAQQKAATQPAKPSPKQNKVHVEFKEEPEEVVEVPVEKEVKDVINKKRVKKVRPILIKKAIPEKALPVDSETPSANHFEDIHPKDEFELLHSNSREDIHKPEKTSKKSKNQKQEPQQQQQPEKTVVPESQPVEKEKVKEDKVFENTVVPLTQESVVNTGKEKKKKKSEYNAKQQMTAERDYLINSVRNAELSRTEVQMLIDLLLNKQLDSPTVINEWSEGKSDPVQKLKKQLAEKEKLLIEEQEALVGVQAKLKEVRSEQLADRAQLQQKLRASEESKLALLTTHDRLQQTIQELQEQRNKEIQEFKRIVEENNALKIQRGQLEVTLMNYQETDALIHNLKTENNHLTNELQRLSRELQEQGTNSQNCVIQITTLQEQLRSRDEYVMNMERNHEFAMRGQTEEKRTLTEEIQKLKQDIVNIQKNEQTLLDAIAQLKAENQKLQEEKKVQINGSSEESKAHEVKLLNLTNELSSVKSELSSVNSKFQDAERQYQSEFESSSEKFTKLESELEEQKNKNNELRKKNWKVMEALNAAESRNKPADNKSADLNINKITLDLKVKEQSSQKEFLQRLFPEIEDLQTVTSDDWQTEFGRLIKQHVFQLQQKSEICPSSPDKSQEVIKLQSEIQHYKKIIDDTEGILRKLQSHIEFEEREWRIRLSEKDSEILELKNKSLSQKDEPENETPLNCSDSNGIQFAYKCMEKSLPVIIDELQVKVSSLENQLAQEQTENQRLLEERQQLANKPEIKTVHVDSTATIERLSEEIDRLKEQLRIEQSKNGDASVYQNGNAS